MNILTKLLTELFNYFFNKKVDKIIEKKSTFNEKIEFEKNTKNSLKNKTRKEGTEIKIVYKQSEYVFPTIKKAINFLRNRGIIKESETDNYMYKSFRNNKKFENFKYEIK